MSETGRLFLKEIFGNDMSKKQEQIVLDICNSNSKEMDEFVDYITETGDISIDEMIRVINSF